MPALQTLDLSGCNRLSQCHAMLQCDPSKRCSNVVSDGKKFRGKHATDDSRGGRTEFKRILPRGFKRKLPRTIAPPTSVTDSLFDGAELMEVLMELMVREAMESMELEAERREKKARVEAQLERAGPLLLAGRGAGLSFRWR